MNRQSPESGPVLLKEYLMLHANEGHDVAVVVVVVVVAKVSLVEVQLKVHVDLEVVIVSLGILGGEVLLEELDEVGVEGDVFYGGGEVAAGVVHQAWEEGFLKLVELKEGEVGVEGVY
jgi:hypothetical protein